MHRLRQSSADPHSLLDEHNGCPDKITSPLAPEITSPLTPDPDASQPTKQVLKLLDIFQQCKAGRFFPESPWQKYKLRSEEYSDLIRLLQRDESLVGFVEDKIRYDYNPVTETLILRMPSLVHEVFLARVVLEVQQRLLLLTNAEDQSKSFAEKIKHNGSPSLFFPSYTIGSPVTIQHDPDAVFKHSDALWPGVIIEVSYSQKRKDLKYLADDYILLTDGSVNAVVGLDIHYKKDKGEQARQGTISMWRPKYVSTEQGGLELEAEQFVDHEVFRDGLGKSNPAPGAGLRLNLEDFAIEGLNEGISDSILIESALLCQFLDEAEQVERDSKQKLGFKRQLGPDAKRRRRQKTPEDELLPEDDQQESDASSFKPADDDNSSSSS